MGFLGSGKTADPPRWHGDGTRATRLWTLDLLALVTSVCFLGAIVGLLAVNDGRPIFDHQFVTLNTLVAILSAAAKATLLFAVSNAIGQWKWISFTTDSTRRRLLDFERIESASRGPLGSLYLLFNFKVHRAYVACSLHVCGVTSLTWVFSEPTSYQ